MNAAFLLMTSAMLVGQGGDKKPVAAPPAMTAPATAAVSSGCGSDCGSSCGCEGFGHRLRTRMGGLFHRNNCDSCQPTTCQTTHVRAHNTCDTCQPKIFTWQPKCNTCNTCAPTSCGDSCGHAHVGIFERLRGSFARGGCCDTGCSGGCGSVTTPAGTTTAPVKTSEPIVTPPKKLPVEKAPEKAPVPDKAPAPVNPPKVGSVGIGAPIAPATPNTISVTPSIPSVELAPVPAPRVEGDRRDPF